MSSTGSVSSSTGLVSGTDYASLISDLMEVAEAPLQSLESKVSAYEVTLSAYSTLSSDLSSLETALEALSSSSDGFSLLSATSSDTSIVTVSADTDATLASYDVTVTQLAKGQKLQSTSFDESEAVGAGTLTLTVGDSSTEITVDSDDTISDIADAINAADAGVTATVVTSGTTQVLMLKSTDTGTENAFTVTVTDSDGEDEDASGLSRLSYTGGTTGNQMTETQEAEDAIFTIDGVEVTSSSNTVSDAVKGLTFTLKGVSESGDSTTVTVKADTTSILSEINDFVTAYNTVMDYIATKQSYDSDTGDAGTLLGDSTVNRIRSKLREYLNNEVSGLSLTDLGITLNGDGDLEIDTDTLSSALTDDFDAVKKLFTNSSEGLAVAMADSIDSWINEDDGTLTAKSNGIQDTIDRLEEREEQMQARLDKQEEILTAKFNALEVLLSSLDTTASSVDSLITALENLNTQISGG